MPCLSSSVLKDFKASTWFVPWFSICLSNALPRAGYVNLACAIILA